MVSVVIDLDDVMIPLNDTICNKYSIDKNKLTAYKTLECNISDREKSLILDSYNNIEIFREAGLYKEAYQAIELLHTMIKDKSLEVFIDSSCFSPEVANYKLELIHKEMGFVPDSNIKLGLRIPGDTNVKRIRACDIIIEDYINNIYRAERYKYAFLIERPYNKDMCLEDNISRQLNVYEAVKSMKCLIENSII